MGFDDKLVRKKLEVLLKDEALVTLYLRTYGPKLDMGAVARIKQSKQEGQGDVAQGGASDDPTYQIKVKCPICNQGDIMCLELKAKSLTTTPDKFMVPRYQGVKGFKAMNYSLAAVTVCPSCLMASPDKKDFITYSVATKSENKSQLTPYVLDELRKKVEERKMLAAPAADYPALFRHPRSVDSAILSYRLAIHRALVEASFETTLSWYKAGMYGLRIALLLRDTGRDDEAVLKDSVKYLAKSFRNSELKAPDSEFQLLYVLAAVYLRLGDQTQCQAYLGVLDKRKAELVKLEKEDPAMAANVALVEKWLDKVKDLWTDREDPDLWKH